MADLQALRDRPMPGNPGEPVRHPALAAIGQLAVAVGLGRALPDVAAGQRIDLGEAGEALLRRPAAGATPFVGVTRFTRGTLTHACIIREACSGTYFGH